jgi:NTP pyrophosphatase (non-canonical NTP hydrolase)
MIDGCLDSLASYCHELAKTAGWWKPSDYVDPNVIGTKFALIHSEISEALEGYRKNINDSHLPNRSSIEVELSDALIRIFDLAGALKLNLDAAFCEKIDYNLTRQDHKLEERAKEFGKKF